MLHWAMPCSLLNRIGMAIKMTRDGGTFVRIVDFVIIHNHS
jgi:hypothetical protein